MMTIGEVRKQYPQYSDMSDTQLADALHGKFYSDMPKEDFYGKVGLSKAGAPAEGPKEKSAVQTAVSYARPVLELGGMTAGAMMGAPGGPLTSVAGGSLGYAAGRQAANYLEEKAGIRKPAGMGERLIEAGKDLPMGAAMEAGGAVIGKGIEAAGGLISKAAPKLYESVVKPVPSMDKALRDKATKAGLEGEYMATEGGLKKLQADIDIVNKSIARSIDKATRTNSRVDMNEVATRVEQLKDFYRRLPAERAKPFLDEIDDIAKQYSAEGTITPQRAQEMKQSIYALHRKHYGEMKSAIVEAEKQIARGLKEEIVKIHPELAKLNAKDSALINLENVLERTVNRTGNWNLIGLQDLVGGTVGAVTGATGDGLQGGTAGAVTGLLLTRALRSPAVMSQISFAINKANRIKAPAMTSRAAAYGTAKMTE